MANTAQLGALYTQGLRNEFAMFYQPRYRGVTARIGEVIWLEATSDKLQEVYGLPESPPYPVRWEAGNMIPQKAFGSLQFTVVNRDFGRRVYLPKNWEDDQTGTAFTVARSLGQNWGTLAERIFYQFIGEGLTIDSNVLLPAVPNSADGSALYISTSRFGASSGNIVTQTGTSTVQQIITDLYSVHRRFNEFQNTESQPFWDPMETNAISVFYGTQLDLVLQQALRQTRIHSTIAGTSTTNVQTGAATTNILQEGLVNFAGVMSQRITGTNLYCFLRGVPNYMRAIFRQVRKGVNEAQGNWATSDHTRDTGEPYVQFDSREGWGSPPPTSTIRVS